MKSAYDPIADEDQDRPDKRAEWNMKGREAPKGQSAAALRYRAHQQKMAMRARAAAEAATKPATQSAPAPFGPFGPGSGWVALGPAPLASDSGTGQDYGLVTGRSTAIAIDPSDSTGATVYGAGAYGGVWKTTNGTAVPATSVSWSPVIDQQSSLAVGAISVQPVTTNPVVLVGTGEPNNAIDSYYGVGVFRSANGGTSWTEVPTSDSGTLSFLGLGFTKFAWSTANTSLVVASTATTAIGFDNGAIDLNTKRGLYRSTDSGQHWTYQQLTDGSTPISVSDVVYNATAGMFFASVRFHGIYSSTDGTSFTRLTNQPGTLTLTNCPVSGVTSCPLYRGQLAVTPGRDEMYFWFIDANISDQGVWRTNDHGQTWTKLSSTGFAACGDPNGCGPQQAFYNMDLMAVTNGSTATDLYLGAVNLFKCSLASNATTTCSGGSWLNLTHVYNCTAFTPHPDEHGIDSKIVGGKAIVYIGNDGGFYRALDGFTGLNSNNCPGNSWDDLNTNMGSMTQFVSFSIHPTDQKTVLGGTQDNGSPATGSATTSTSWLNVNAGDGGYNEINPTTPTQWFTANTDVSIQKCASGISCNAFTFLPVVSAGNASIGGDSGAFYTPYILDPQNAAELIVGTCRVWRGSTTNFSGSLALSSNFDTGSGACTGGETNLVRGLAAGGPLVGGFSSVVYATTQGTGPNGGASGGEVWATTAAGTTMMTDVTGSINPSNYTISSVAVDNSDATGKTAFVGIMGFGVSHVFKTTNAGGAWANWTGTGGSALPDAPVNALLVDKTDPAGPKIYAGTDVGVFVSSTASASWTEVGPNAQPGAAGYLPNVPVTAIRLFNSGGVKKLRVSTYGRGIWEFDLNATPDFTNVVSNPTQTVFGSQQATFNGTLTALAGYNTPVNLSCTAGTSSPPSTCNLSAAQVTPTAGGAAYTITAAGAIGDYTFNAHATDGTLTHDAAITLHVVDFNLTAPNPNTITAVQGSISNTTTFQVSASGSFSGTVNLSCPSGLPTGATCGFTPSASVNPTSGTPVTVTLTVNTLNTTPTGTATVTLSAATTGAPAAKTQTFKLTVNPPPPDFTNVISNAAQNVSVLQNATFNGTLTALGGYNKSVTLSCIAGMTAPPPTCTPSPNPLTPTGAGAAYTVTAGGTVAQAYNFGVRATDGTLTHTQVVTLTLSPDVNVPQPLTNPAAANPGQSSSTTMNLTPAGGATFGANVTYSCTSGLPAGATCSFSPTSINSGAAATAVTVTINTAGPFTGSAGSTRPRITSEKRFPRLPLSLPIAGIVLAGLAGMPRRYKIVGLCLAVAFTGFLAACGGGGSPPPPPVISVSVAPSSVNTLFPNIASPPGAPAQTQQFTAHVNNDTNQTVTWAVNGGGAIDSTGLYTAPATVPAGAVTVTATSPDTTTPGSASVHIQTPTSSGTYPITVTVTEGTHVHATTFSLKVN